MFVGDFDQEIAAMQSRATTNESYRVGVESLAKTRDECSAKLDSFLSHSRKGDELWFYKTTVTADGRGGTYGIAIVRDHKVVRPMQFFIID